MAGRVLHHRRPGTHGRDQGRHRPLALMAIPRKVATRFWKIVNPIALPFAGFAPWWILVETTGRKTGKARRVPLARGPIDGTAYLIDAVHGHQAAWVRNIEANPSV